MSMRFTCPASGCSFRIWSSSTTTSTSIQRSTAGKPRMGPGGEITRRTIRQSNRGGDSHAHVARLVGRAGSGGGGCSDQDRHRCRDSMVRPMETLETLETTSYPATAIRRWPQWVQLVPGTLLLAIVGFAG